MRAPKGTRDVEPPESEIIDWILSIARRVFRRYGFKPMYHPAFEELRTLEAKSGEEIREQIYVFQDKSHRWLGLRFDHTIGLARYASSRLNLQLPVKRYTFGPVWRYEEVKAKERWREFWQMDADIIGVEDVVADVECVSAVADVLRELGIKNFEIRYNNRKLLSAIWSDEAREEEKFLAVCRAIDKLEKRGKQAIMEELSDLGLANIAIQRFFNLADNLEKRSEEEKIEVLAEFLADISKAQDQSGLMEIKAFTDTASDAGLEKLLHYDLTLARGLDYYTSLIFEFKLGEGGESIAGGGRYNDLIRQLGGRNIPATGISIGVSRLASYLLEEKMEMRDREPRICVISIKPEYRREAVKVAYKLRRRGFCSEYDLRRRGFSKQLERCVKRGFEFAVFIGEREVKSGKLRLKDLRTQKEAFLTLEEVVEKVRDQGLP